MTCEDWKYNANQTGKPGCYGKHSCCPPEDGSWYATMRVHRPGQYGPYKWAYFDRIHAHA